MSAELLSALLVGLFGSSHCLLMCGGMAGALQLMMPGGRAHRFWLQLMLGLGRISSYALTGALFGGLGAGFIGISGLTPAFLQLLAGLMLLAMALYISRLWFGLLWLERAGKPLWQLLQPLTRRLQPLDRSHKAFAYGLLWGYLPCGLVYSALSWSLGSGSALSGALWMAAFGLGTLPAVLLAGQAASVLRRYQQMPAVRYLLAAGLAGYGLMTAWRAFGQLFR